MVAIEDLERFADHHCGRAAGEHAAYHERGAPLQALLHLLDRVPRVSVLLAAPSLEVWPDEATKVARSIERIPTLDPEQALPLLRRFHQGCATMLHADGCALIAAAASTTRPLAGCWARTTTRSSCSSAAASHRPRPRPTAPGAQPMPRCGAWRL